MNRKRAIIMGAGPAGLTAAYELLTRSNVQPVVLEQDDVVGGLSRTVAHHGNRIDIGPHRFFSKSDRVTDWWLRMLPLEGSGESSADPVSMAAGSGDPRRAQEGERNPDTTDEVMLVRRRKSRIYYNRRFFDYPIRLNRATISNLGLVRSGRIGASCLKARVFPVRPETTLEHFLINRFGKELYRTFFKSYTEKVWGVPCDRISAEWGAQRIKGLSLGKALLNALSAPFRGSSDLGQNSTETSLIEQFLYPKLGPGQMWETCARRVQQQGGSVLLNQRVEQVHTDGDRIAAVTATDRRTGRRQTFEGDYFFSTIPIRNLVRAWQAVVPQVVREISDGLVYRDFITVGLLLSELKITDSVDPRRKYPSDNWIYIQEPGVHVGRLQIFNNWSPYLVADPADVWIGLEYFCNQGDSLWSLPDDEMARLGIDELSRIGILDASKVRDWTVIRIPKAYPAYFGSYDRFAELRSWLDRFDNLFLLGRNGMHRYNNQDHSMLTAMVAVDNVIEGILDKGNIWAVNAEKTYQEERSAPGAQASPAAQRSALRT